MKIKLQTKILLCFFYVFLLALTNHAQIKKVTYNKLNPDFFTDYKQPVVIGILKFEGSEDFQAKLYDELKNQTGISNKYTIFPYNTILSQISLLQIKGEVTPDNEKAMLQLSKNLKIDLVISGSYKNIDDFTLRLITTSDGKEIFENEFETSEITTALNDVLKFLKNKLVPTYSITDYLNLTLNIDSADVKIDGNEIKNLNKIELAVGRHKIEIEKEGYKKIDDFISPDLSAEKFSNIK